MLEASREITKKMDKEGPDAIIADANALAEDPIAQTGNATAIPVAADSINITETENDLQRVAVISVADVAADSSNITEMENDLQRAAEISVADVALSIAAVGLHGTMDFITPAGTGGTLDLEDKHGVMNFILTKGFKIESMRKVALRVGLNAAYVAGATAQQLASEIQALYHTRELEASKLALDQSRERCQSTQQDQGVDFSTPTRTQEPHFASTTPESPDSVMQQLLAQTQAMMSSMAKKLQTLEDEASARNEVNANLAATADCATKAAASALHQSRIEEIQNLHDASLQRTFTVPKSFDKAPFGDDNDNNAKALHLVLRAEGSSDMLDFKPPNLVIHRLTRNLELQQQPRELVEQIFIQKDAPTPELTPALLATPFVAKCIREINAADLALATSLLLKFDSQKGKFLKLNIAHQSGEAQLPVQTRLASMHQVLKRMEGFLPTTLQADATAERMPHDTLNFRNVSELGSALSFLEGVYDGTKSALGEGLGLPFTRIQYIIGVLTRAVSHFKTKSPPSTPRSEFLYFDTVMLKLESALLHIQSVVHGGSEKESTLVAAIQQFDVDHLKAHGAQPPSSEKWLLPPRTEPPKQHANAVSDSSPCSKCLKPGHDSASCPNLVVCHNCGKTGHYSSKCPTNLTTASKQSFPRAEGDGR